MEKQLWKKYTESMYQTSVWSGGTTTQLAIAPEGAVYGDRSFLWRLSSARVDLPHSTFTALPEYDRIIAPLEGQLVMKCGEEACFALKPLELCAFDGAAETESWGTCRDFNLMLRKGQCRGAVQALQLQAGAALQWTPPVLSATLQKQAANLVQKQLAIYCVSGEVTLETDGEGLAASAGELLLCAPFSAYQMATPEQEAAQQTPGQQKVAEQEGTQQQTAQQIGGVEAAAATLPGAVSLRSQKGAVLMAAVMEAVDLR